MFQFFTEYLFLLFFITVSVNGDSFVITGDSSIELYINGELRSLTHGADWSMTDGVELQDGDRLVAFHAVGNDWCSGVIGSTDDGRFMTGYSFRCTGIEYEGWNELGYEDTVWRTSYITGDNHNLSPVCGKWQHIPEIAIDASWIWTANQTDDLGGVDGEVYCRGYLPVCEESPCLNGGYCNPNGIESVCECLPGYTGLLCETHLVQTCGDLLKLAPPDIPIHPKFDLYCYISSNETNYLDYQCRELVIGIPGYPTSDDLLRAGGNFGCWVTKEYPDEFLPYACVDNYQHSRSLASCQNCNFMGVCIRFPPW